ncbi:Protein-lysine N-methyltransferase efm4 [Coemansia sp. RSA 1822]|nr:Protein-lysine N-methyltransferase efm4 [Coemansia sp. RSA 638]KAJ2540700.1 Protein-lysine N-methyltransferase efm4 [Coemansia sp. RSA 1853]KAJ2560844.1 Protein-lysine N-methyltransferase efm4 [Coemansia sp. RSA 1822]
MSSLDKDTPAFEASRLGRKDHWDTVYDRELRNYETTGDIGEIWFGSSAATKMVSWVARTTQPTARILDVGCGNGHLLLELASRGYTNLTGTDYSAQAVRLAHEIALSSFHDITYAEQDFLDPEQVARVAGSKGFDVVLDKGTYDAICLMPMEDGSVDQKAIDVYPESVARSLAQDGVFLITSCNWTEDELVARFKDHLVLFDRVKHATFAFGGAVGQTVVTVAFKKRQAA